MKWYVIRDREAGNIIEAFTNLKEAKEALVAYEADDKAEGIYTPNFYEIVESIEK